MLFGRCEEYEVMVTIVMYIYEHRYIITAGLVISVVLIISTIILSMYHLSQGDCMQFDSEEEFEQCLSAVKVHCNDEDRCK